MGLKSFPIKFFLIILGCAVIFVSYFWYDLTRGWIATNIPEFRYSREGSEPKIETELFLRHPQVASWQSYPSEKFKFEIKYPGEWTIGYGAGESSEVIILSSAQRYLYRTGTGEEDLPRITVTFIANQNYQGQDLDGLAQVEKERWSKREYDFISATKVYFQNQLSQKQIFVKDKSDVVDYVLLRAGNTYRISAEIFEKDEDLIEIVNQILATVQFTD